MQKKLIALAVAGLASTGAFAQANVTVYGVADATFDVVRASNVKDGYDLGNTTRVSSNSSYIGFKGAEALGNGLTAVFQVESGVDFAAGGNPYGYSHTQGAALDDKARAAIAHQAKRLVEVAAKLA